MSREFNISQHRYEIKVREHMVCDNVTKYKCTTDFNINVATCVKYNKILYFKFKFIWQWEKTTRVYNKTSPHTNTQQLSQVYKLTVTVDRKQLLRRNLRNLANYWWFLRPTLYAIIDQIYLIIIVQLITCITF